MAAKWARSVLAAAFILTLHPGIAQAQAEDGTTGNEAERLMGEGLQKILQALDLLLKTVPQYSAPEVLPNGDIIIRRVHPEDEGDEELEEPAEPAPTEDSTET